ncbi:hypothetical protein PUN28_008547 [Cardiocondyla obscurior]|uniref:Uncharacterized protein n=1 Tax=Cardiocondyla obscurior TaxID=286306 RepID=A0AAW2G048_9HYME
MTLRNNGLRSFPVRTRTSELRSRACILAGSRIIRLQSFALNHEANDATSTSVNDLEHSRALRRHPRRHLLIGSLCAALRSSNSEAIEFTIPSITSVGKRLRTVGCRAVRAASASMRRTDRGPPSVASYETGLPGLKLRLDE